MSTTINLPEISTTYSKAINLKLSSNIINDIDQSKFKLSVEQLFEQISSAISDALLPDNLVIKGNLSVQGDLSVDGWSLLSNGVSDQKNLVVGFQTTAGENYSIAHGAETIALGKYSFASGYKNYIPDKDVSKGYDGQYSIAMGECLSVYQAAAEAHGWYVTIHPFDGKHGTPDGTRAFVWNGHRIYDISGNIMDEQGSYPYSNYKIIDDTGTERACSSWYEARLVSSYIGQYEDQGAHTFCINPENGIDGFFIGEKSLQQYLNELYLKVQQTHNSDSTTYVSQTYSGSFTERHIGHVFTLKNYFTQPYTHNYCYINSIQILEAFKNGLYDHENIRAVIVKKEDVSDTNITRTTATDLDPFGINGAIIDPSIIIATSTNSVENTADYNNTRIDFKFDNVKLDFTTQYAILFVKDSYITADPSSYRIAMARLCKMWGAQKGNDVPIGIKDYDMTSYATSILNIDIKTPNETVLEDTMTEKKYALTITNGTITPYLIG